MTLTHIDDIVGMSEIAKEQEEKSKCIAKMNRWLGKGYDFRIVNYSVCNLKGDNEKALRTLKLVADDLKNYVTTNL